MKQRASVVLSVTLALALLTLGRSQVTLGQTDNITEVEQQTTTTTTTTTSATTNSTITTTTSSPEVAQTLAPNCADDEFQCNSSLECIPLSWECDHKIDCADGSDELPHTGSEEESDDSMLAGRVVKYCDVCGQHYFRCRVSKECIPRGWLCDGQLDCGYGDESDEKNDECLGMNEQHVVDNQAQNQTRPLLLGPFVVGHNRTHLHTLIPSFTNITSMQRIHLASNESLDIATMLTITKDSNICWLNGKSSSIQCVSTLLVLDAETSNTTEPKVDKPSPETLSLPNYIDASAISRITLDWLTDNWYLLDSEHEVIYLCTYRFEQCIVVMDYRLLSRPICLELDATEGLMFVTRRGDKSRIEDKSIGPAILRASHDGTEAIVLVDTRLLEPAHLSLDATQRRVFWVDTQLDLLEYVDYDGNNRHKLEAKSKSSWTNLISMFAIENRVFLMSLKQKNVNEEDEEESVAVKFIHFATLDLGRNSSSKQMLARSAHLSSVALVYNVAYRQVAKLIKLLCVKCRHSLCIPKFDHTQYQMISAECVNQSSQPGDTPLLVYSRGQPGLIQLKYLANQSSVRNPLPLIFSKCPIAFDIDPYTGTIYYADDLQLRLVIQPLFAANNTAPVQIVAWRDYNISRLESIAVDSINKNLYLLDSEKGNVIVKSMANMSLTKHIRSRLANPKAMVLDQNNSLLFYSQYGNGASKLDISEEEEIPASIERTNLDGSDKITLVQKERLRFPNGLAVDGQSRRLYWCDSFYKRIESITYDGHHRKVILQSARIGIATSLHYFRHSLYWTELQHGTLQQYDLQTRQSVIVLQNKAPLYHVAIVPSAVWYNRTLNIQCEQFTLAKENSVPVCGCDDRFELSTLDQRTCLPKPNSKACGSGEELFCATMKQCFNIRHFNATCMGHT